MPTWLIAGIVKVTPRAWVYVPWPYPAVASRVLRGLESEPATNVVATSGPVAATVLARWPASVYGAAADVTAKSAAGMSSAAFGVPAPSVYTNPAA